MKTRLIFKPIGLFLAVFFVYFLFSDAAGNTNKATDKTTTCTKTICVTYPDGTPVANHSIYIFDSGGNEVGNCTTGDNGCCTSTYEFIDGAKYTLCDQSVDCPTNCKKFVISCASPGGLAMQPCGN